MPSESRHQPLTARESGLASCHTCSHLSGIENHHCVNCGEALHSRKPASVQRTWALLVTAALLFIPAMTLPVSTVHTLIGSDPSTLMDSVIYFLGSGSWPIAVVIFVASILVPLVKIIGLSFLLISIQSGSTRNQVQRTRLYRAIEFIGRWSMIDVFVVSILVALVHFGIFLQITPGTGIAAFAGVVVITMFAAMSFDPRLIWDVSN